MKRHVQKRNKAVLARYLFLVGVISFLLLIISTAFFTANAQGIGEAETVHEIAYTQPELAAMVQQAGGLEPAEAEALRQQLFDTLNASALDTEIIEDGAVVQNPDNENSYLATWVAGQLEGKLLLDTYTEDDGCLVVIAFDTDALELHAFAINANSAVHAVNLQVGKAHEMPIEIETYTVAPVIEEVEIAAPPTEEGGTETGVEESSGNAATQEVQSEEPKPEVQPEEPKPEVQAEEIPALLPAEEPDVLPAEIPTEVVDAGNKQPDIVTLSATAESEAPQDIETPQSTSPAIVEVITGYALETDWRYTSGDIQETGATMALRPYGVATVSIKTGMLYGGALGSSVPLQQAAGAMAAASNGPITGITLQDGPATYTSGAHGWLTIYSKADALPDGSGNFHTGDYAVYSQSPANYYDIDSNTEITINSITTSGHRYFHIDLQNSEPVDIKALNAYSNGGTTVTSYTVVGGKEKSVLNIANKAGAAITINYNLRIEQGVVVNAVGSTYGVEGSRRSEASLGVVDKAELHASAPGGTAGVYVRDMVFVGSYGFLEANGGEYGIQASYLVTRDGVQSYSTIDDFDKQDRSRVRATGDKYGMSITDSANALYLGAGTLVYGEGNEVAGVHCDTTRSSTINVTATPRYKAIGIDSNMTESQANNQYGTLFAVGTGPDSAGWIVENSRTTAYAGMREGGRYVLIGEKYGFYYSAGVTSTYDSSWTVSYGAEMLAYGNEYGVYMTNGSYKSHYFRTRVGGGVYARGGVYGALLETGNWESWFGARGSQSIINNYWDNYGPKQDILIGGVDNVSMPSGNVLNNPQNWLTERFDYDKLPEPVVWDEYDHYTPLPYKPGTAGLEVGVTKANGALSYISAYHLDGSIHAYGGDLGAHVGTEGTYVASYEGGNIEAHGGRIGILTEGSYIHVWSNDNSNLSGAAAHTGTLGNSILKGYGKEYGVYTTGTGNSTSCYITTTSVSNGRSYVYGYGETTGIWSAGYIQLSQNAQIVAETVADGEADPGDPHAQPALVSAYTSNGVSKSIRFSSTGSDALIHEIYQVVNYNIASPPPFAINAEIPAIGEQMGTTPKTLLALNWTTPLNGPNRSADGRDWLDYDPTDDQLLVKPGTIDGVTGLVAMGNGFNSTLVGQSSGTIWQMMQGATDGTLRQYNLSGGASTKSAYRITIRGATVRNYQTTNVDIDLNEKLGAEIYNLPTDMATMAPFVNAGGKIPDNVQYKLEWVPEGSDISDKREVIVDKNNHLVLQDGVLTLRRLLIGEYWLTPVDDLGYPYAMLPTIHFKIRVDTSPAVPSPAPGTGSYPSYPDYWYEKLFLVVEDDPSPGDTRDVLETGDAKVMDQGTMMAPTDPGRTEQGTIHPPPYPDYDVNPRRHAEMQVYYTREKGDMQLMIVDAESLEKLEGELLVTRTLDGNPVAGLNDITLQPSTDASGNITWPMITAYAGMDYAVSQTEGNKDYFPASGTLHTRLTRDATGYPVFAAAAQATTMPATEYRQLSNNSAPYYTILILNDQPSVDIDVKLIDKDVFNGGAALSPLLANAAFDLTAKYGDGSSAARATTPDNAGTVGITLKPHRTYYMKQTATDPGYQMRDGTYCFVLDNVQYTRDTNGYATGISSYSIKLLGYNGTEDADGVQSIQGWNILPGQQHPVYITNNLANNGTLAVEVEATGLWSGHDDAILLVELRGNDASTTGHVFYQTVNFNEGNGGSTDALNTADPLYYRTHTATQTALFEDIPAGGYDVIVHAALRTGQPGVAYGTAEDPLAMTPVKVSVQCKDYTLLSAGAESTTLFEIDAP